MNTKSKSTLRKFELFLSMQTFTKNQLIEITLRPIKGTIPPDLYNTIVIQAELRAKHQLNSKFILEMRRATKLKVCSFAPGLYHIKY
jgi:hypothetical protein